MTRVVTGLLCIVCLTLTACANQRSLGLSDELDRSAKAYNRMLRWHELENAVVTYSDPEQREEFQKQAEAFKKRGISITDYRILSTRYLPETQSGDVVTEFDYYILPSNMVKTISNRQEWVYRESIKSWKLKNGLPRFE